jgi:C_GCAxxG_C_C family probable redox protein
MSQKSEKAASYFKQSFNCSQAVFTAYRQEDKISEETALKLATVFGAGVACSGADLCGAVTGALMAISLKHGRGDVKALDAKTKTYGLGMKFMEEFSAKNGSCICGELLGVDISTPEGLKEAQELKLFETRCLDMVKSACEILEKNL